MRQVSGKYRNVPSCARYRAPSRRWWQFWKAPQYRTLEPFDWEASYPGSDDWIHIPAGTVFDSSVPFLMWWFISPWSMAFRLAALVHDTILNRGIRTRTNAASEWFHGARAAKAPMWKARPAFVGVAAWAVRPWKDGA